MTESPDNTQITIGGGAVIYRSVSVYEDLGRDAYYGYTAEQVRALIAEIRCSDQPQTWDGRAPYSGLSAFRETDAHAGCQ